MKRFLASPSNTSSLCMSSLVPSVVVTSAWVSPRVKIAEPWVRGNTPTSIQIGRIWSNARLSGRRLSPITCSRKMRSRRISK